MDADESSLDISFKRSVMTEEDLRHELRKKDLECSLLMRTIEQKEREFLEKERTLRHDLETALQNTRDCDKKYFEEQEKILKSFHAKKVSPVNTF